MCQIISNVDFHCRLYSGTLGFIVRMAEVIANRIKKLHIYFWGGGGVDIQMELSCVFEEDGSEGGGGEVQQTAVGDSTPAAAGQVGILIIINTNGNNGNGKKSTSSN